MTLAVLSGCLAEQAQEPTASDSVAAVPALPPSHESPKPAPEPPPATAAPVEPPTTGAPVEEPAREPPPATAAPIVDIPVFPWPPPRASTMMNLRNDLWQVLSDSLRLGDVDAQIRQALAASGYVEHSYFAVPDGFALVTRLEQIRPDGTPKDPPARWADAPGPVRTFSLRAILRALFTADPGYFRMLVFIVTPHPFVQADASVARAEAEAWLHEGLNRLPAAIARQPYTASHVTTALVYEFEQPDGAEPHVLLPSRHTARVHLSKSGLLPAIADAAPDEGGE